MHGRVSMRVRCHSLTISGVLFAVIGVEVPEYRVPGLGRRFFSGNIMRVRSMSQLHAV